LLGYDTVRISDIPTHFRENRDIENFPNAKTRNNDQTFLFMSYIIQQNLENVCPEDIRKNFKRRYNGVIVRQQINFNICIFKNSLYTIPPCNMKCLR